jgi:hypothetical protein
VSGRRLVTREQARSNGGPLFPTPLGSTDGAYDAEVSRIEGGEVFVRVPAYTRDREYGPCRLLAPAGAPVVGSAVQLLLTNNMEPVALFSGTGPEVVSSIRAGDTITLVLEDAPAGLTGLAVGIRRTPTREAVVAATTAGVGEHSATDGSTYYSAARTIPPGAAATNQAAGTGYEAYWTHLSLSQPAVEEIVVA